MSGPTSRMEVDAAPRLTVLIGGALDPEVVRQYRGVSAAGAKWQIDAALALAEQGRGTVHCLSYLPVGQGESFNEHPVDLQPNLRVQPVARGRGLVGSLRYFSSMLRQVLKLRDRTDLVLCYNPLIWTAPWARLLARISGAPMVMVVADLEPDAATGRRRQLRRRVERALLGTTSRYLILSPAVRQVLSPQGKVSVFNGMADPVALRQPAPRYRGQVRFVYAGSLDSYAGVDVFIEAAERLVTEGGECEFHLFGRGTLPCEPSDTLAPRLHHHGFVSEEQLNAFLGEDCVGVNPRQERNVVNQFNAPYKLLFYLSRGVLVVTTATAGVPDDLAEVCVTAGDGVEELTDAMRRVLAMPPQERTESAARGRSRVRATRSAVAFSAVVEQLAGIDGDAAAPPRPRERGVA